MGLFFTLLFFLFVHTSTSDTRLIDTPFCSRTQRKNTWKYKTNVDNKFLYKFQTEFWLWYFSFKAAFFLQWYQCVASKQDRNTSINSKYECICSYLAINNFYTFCSCVIHMVPPLICKLLAQIITYLQRTAIKNTCSPSEPIKMLIFL